CQRWGPPSAGRAIVPLWVVGLLAPLATLVILLGAFRRFVVFGRDSSSSSFEVYTWRVPKGKIVVRTVAWFSRDSGAWYRAVCLARGPMSGIGSTVSLCPFGARGFKSHSRRQPQDDIFS